jgi:hypothetical protein
VLLHNRREKVEGRVTRICLREMYLVSLGAKKMVQICFHSGGPTMPASSHVEKMRHLTLLILKSWVNSLKSWVNSLRRRKCHGRIFHSPIYSTRHQLIFLQCPRMNQWVDACLVSHAQCSTYHGWMVGIPGVPIGYCEGCLFQNTPEHHWRPKW